MPSPLDLIFLFQLFSVIVGLIAIYYCIMYYRKIGSKNYLLVGYLFFTHVYGQLTLMYMNYFSSLFYYENTQNPLFWNLENAIPYLAVQTVWAIHFPVIAYLLYNFLDLKKRFYKGFFLIFAIEGILQGFYYLATYVVWFLSRDFARGKYLMDFGFLKLWSFHLLFDDPTGAIAIQVYSVIFYFLIGFTFFKLKRPFYDKTLVYSQRIWLVYGLLQGLRWIWVLFFLENVIFNFEIFSPTIQMIIVFLRDDIFGYYGQFLEAIALGGILVMLILNPGSILISEAQLVKAKKIYDTILVDSATSETKSKIYRLLSPNQRVSEYIRSIPPEIMKDLRSKALEEVN